MCPGTTSASLLEPPSVALGIEYWSILWFGLAVGEMIFKNNLLFLENGKKTREIEF
jgi:hypothetical protein